VRVVGEDVVEVSLDGNAEGDVGIVEEGKPVRVLAVSTSLSPRKSLISQNRERG
jgi:hypothetical protein